MRFTESNTVEAYVRDLLAGPIKGIPANTVQEPVGSFGPSPNGIGWRYVAPSEVPRQVQEVLVEPWLREALIRLNPAIAAQPDRADEVLYKLRAIVLSVRTDGLIRANEEMTAWMRGERSMPFGPNHASKGTEVGYNAPDSPLERTPLSHAGGPGARSHAGIRLTQRKSIHVYYRSGSICAGFDSVG